jgi:uncharacterized membrane protein
VTEPVGVTRSGKEKHMLTTSSIEIEAPAPVVWDVFVDVERWPEWTRSVRRITSLDGTGVAVGRRFKVEQPRMPKLVWEVTHVDPGISWTWRQRTIGNTTLATHEIVARAGDRTLVRQQIDQRGPLGLLAGMLMRRLTKRYLGLEAQGLKARSEEMHSAAEGT